MANLQESRELAARLVRMGVVSPRVMENLSVESVETVVRNLPPVYESVISAQDRSGTLHTVRMIDVDPREMNRKAIEWFNEHQLSAIPEGRSMENSTPEIWLRYLGADVAERNLESLGMSLSDWSFKDHDSGRLSLGFGGDSEAHLREAETMAEAERRDLAARMVNMGVVEPVEIEAMSSDEVAAVANSMPELVVSNVIVQRDGELEHLRFMMPGDGASSPELETARWQDAFSPFVQSYLMERGINELDVVHRSVEYSGGVDWLEYFNQGADKADPVGDLKMLKNSFRNWDLDFRETRLEKGFQNDPVKNLEDSAFYLNTAVLSKLVNAGVIPSYPKDEWKGMTPEQARAEASKVPLMPGVVDRPGQWLSFFRRENVDLQGVRELFEEHKLLFDEKKVGAAFVVRGGKKQKERNMASKVSARMATDDQKDVISKLVNDDRMDKMARDDWEGLTFDEAKRMIRENDDPASDKQKTFVASLIKDGKLKGFDPVEIPELSKREAAALIGSVDGIANDAGRDRTERPASQETRDKIRKLVEEGRMEKLSPDDWRNLSDKEGQSMIRDFLAKEPASDKQIDKIFDMINSGTVSNKALAAVIKKGVVLESDIHNLTRTQASAIIGHSPASSAQRDRITELVKNGDMPRMSADEWKSLTIGQANDRIKAAIGEDRPGHYGRQGRGDNGGSMPATDAQKDKIRELASKNKIAGIAEEAIESLSKSEAGKILHEAPASQAQKDKISELVKDGFMDKIPLEQWKGLTCGDASKLIEEGVKSAREKELSPSHAGRDDNSPATSAQVKRLKELYDEGKCDEVPPVLTVKAAGEMIAEAVRNDPLTERQMKVLSGMVEKGQVDVGDISRVTQGQFSEIMKSSKEFGSARDAKPASDAQRRTLSDMVQKGHVQKIPREEWGALTSSAASKLIEAGQAASRAGMGMDR